MATTQYNKLLEDVSLDVTPIFTDLMKASTGRGSAYLKAKETVIDYADKSNLTEIEKATLVSKTITDLAQSVTNEAMQVALKIAQENRDAPYTIAKLKEDTRLVTAEIANAEQTKDNAAKDNQIKAMQVKKAQAELYRDYGVNIADLDPTSSLSNIGFTDYGSKVEAIEIAKANRYNTYATSYRQNGVVTLSTDAAGYLTTGTIGDTYGLLTQQYKVAVRQEKSFDDNMRQHAANSSSSMISMLLSTDAPIDNPTQYVDMWKTSINYLNGL